MKVLNIHQAILDAPSDNVGALLDKLASRADRLWPRHAWPPMKFDRPLAVGAVGGHGPIRYTVEHYQPGRIIRFRFTGPKGFNGFHELEVLQPDPASPVVLRHTLSMSPAGLATLSWLLLYRPLHDALLEDALANAREALNLPARRPPWSPYVRFLRWAASRRQPRFGHPKPDT